MAASVDFKSALNVDLDYGNLAQPLNTFQLRSRCAIEAALGALAELHELIVLDHTLELGDIDELEVFLALLVVDAHGSGRHAALTSKDVAIL